MEGLKEINLVGHLQILKMRLTTLINNRSIYARDKYISKENEANEAAVSMRGSTYQEEIDGLIKLLENIEKGDNLQACIDTIDHIRKVVSENETYLHDVCLKNGLMIANKQMYNIRVLNNLDNTYVYLVQARMVQKAMNIIDGVEAMYTKPVHVPDERGWFKIFYDLTLNMDGPLSCSEMDNVTSNVANYETEFEKDLRKAHINMWKLIRTYGNDPKGARLRWVFSMVYLEMMDKYLQALQESNDRIPDEDLQKHKIYVDALLYRYD